MNIQWGFNLAVALAALLLAYSGARRSRSFVPYGLTGIGLGGWLGLTSFTELPDWVTIAIILMAIALYLVGIYRQGVYERMWHLAALVVGLGGKAFCAFVPWLIQELSGSIEVPRWLMLGLGIPTIAALAYLAFRARKGVWRKSKATPSLLPTEEGAVAPDTAETSNQEEVQFAPGPN